MKGFAALARREIAEQRAILWAALACGVLAAVVPMFQSRGAPAAREVRELAASFAAVSFAAGLALTLGATVVAGQLANRRLGFYFARPLSPAVIWGGKFAGVAALVLAAELAAAAPGLLVNAGVSRPALLVLGGALVFSVGVLLPLAHALGIAVRSRSRWLALDFAGAVIVALAVLASSRLLVRELALAPMNRGLAALALVLAGALIVAGFAAVARGRTDLESAHRALSLVLWSIAIPFAALLLGYSVWTISPRLSDLTRVGWASPAPRGDWVQVLGPTKWREEDESRFLVQLSTRRAVRLPGRAEQPLLFSADGRRAVSVEAQYAAAGLSMFAGILTTVRTEGWDVYRIDLDTGSSERRSTGISIPGRPVAAALSGDGSRLALAGSDGGGKTVSVYDLASGRLLGAAPIPREERIHLSFAGPDRIRIYLDGASSQREGELQIFEFDLAGRRIGETGRTKAAAGYRFLRLNPDGTRLLLVSSRSITLLDAVTGDQMTVLWSGEGSSRNAVFLEDGRIAVGERDSDGTHLRLLSAMGVEQKRIPIGPSGRIGLGAEPKPGQLVVSRLGETQSWNDTESLLVDLASGRVRSLGARLIPVTTLIWWSADPARRVAAGSPGATLFLDSGGRLLSVDPDTGERRVLLGSR